MLHFNILIILFCFCYFYRDDSMAGRFSKCPEERERILQKRKEHLIHAARKRYIEKKHGASES